MAAVKKLAVPTLSERVIALRDECDAALGHLAELHRPKGDGAVPAQAIRRMWEARAGGNVFEAYLLAAKEGK